MKDIFLTIFMLSLTLVGHTQQVDSCHHELKGVILDVDTKEALPYVKVQVKGTLRFSLTDTNGAFHFENLCNEYNTLILSCLGYCDTVCENFHQHAKSPHIYIEQDIRQLGTVTITAKEVVQEGIASIAQQRIDKEELASNLTQTLAAAISDINGVTFASTGSNVQLPVIHGLYGNRVLLINNGIKHGFQNWGTDHAPEIDISSADNITIVKGAAGVRYGPEALGGAVIIEADPLYLNEPLKAQVGSGYQTNGRGYFVNTRIGQGSKKWSYHLGANYTRIGDRHAPDYSLTNSGKEEKSFNGGLRYHLENWDFRIYYSYIDQNLALLRSSVADSGNGFARAINSDEPIIINPFSYDINEPSQLTEHHLVKAEMTWQYSDEAKLSLRVGSQLNKREEYDVRRNADTPIIDLDLITHDVQLDWKHPDWLRLDGLVGLQLFTQDNDNNPGTGTTPFIPNYNTVRYSAFVLESLKRGTNTYEIGIRLDQESNNVRGRETNQDIFRDEYSFANLTASFGFIRQISDNASFRTNFGTAWRTLNVSELFSFGQHGFKSSFGLARYKVENFFIDTGEVSTIQDSNASPENGYKWTNEWRLQKHKSIYTVTSYANYIDDFAFLRPFGVYGTIRGPLPYYRYDQTDALFVGTDFTWEKEWSHWLDGTFGVSYLWSRDLTDNDALINQPPSTTSYKLVWNMKEFWKVESSHLTIKPSYTFKQFQAPRTINLEGLLDGSVVITTESEIFDFKDALDGYFLLDISWNAQLGRFDTSVSIKNVFNTSYRNYLNEMRYFADEPGRNFLFTINYTLNNKSY